MEIAFGNCRVVTFVDRQSNTFACHRIYWKRRLKCNKKKRGRDVEDEVLILREVEDVGVVEEVVVDEGEEEQEEEVVVEEVVEGNLVLAGV